MAPRNEQAKAASANAVTDAGTKQVLSESTIQINDRLYNASELARMHPGGELFVKAFAGRDATEAFLSYHRREFPHQRQSDALEGYTEPLKPEGADKDFLELCAIIEKVLPRSKSFAPLSYYLKIAFILSVAVSLEAYIHYYKEYKWHLTATLGFFMALIGLNIQHDANHGAISRNPLVNRLLGITQNYIGGSALDWIHQHVVQHHIHCNDVHEDPDLAGNDLLRLNPLKPLKDFYVGQHIYLFLLIVLFGFNVCVESFLNLIKGFHYTKMSSLVVGNRVFDAMLSLVFFFRWAVLPALQCPEAPLKALLHVVPLFVVGGYYLSFFFIISHNFEGVHMFDSKSARQEHQTFMYKQVTSSSNVGGSFLCFLNGGLNYQIEHHLFPRIQHNHYPTIAPVVRQFCLARGIPYRHFPTVYDNVRSCINHMFLMGHSADKPPTFEVGVSKEVVAQ